MNNSSSPSKIFWIVIAAIFVVATATILVAQTSVPDLDMWDSPHARLTSIEDAKPRFTGDIGGIFIAPDDTTPVPEGYLSYDDVCGSSRTINVPWEEAGVLDLRVDLPKEYRFEEDDLNTGAIACNGVVYAARRSYRFRLPEGQDAYINIGRSILQHDEANISVDQPVVRQIAGREVVIIDLLTDDGSVGNGYAWIPESFGTTYITTTDLPKKDFLELVILVASSTRTQ